MNSRFKLAAALGLALATGFAGVASAQTGTPASMPSQNALTTPSKTTSSETTPAKTAIVKAPMRKTSMKKATIKSRTNVTHRTMNHRKVAKGLSTHAKMAHKVTGISGAKTAKSGLLRRHVAKAKSLYTRHAMKIAAKPTFVR